MNLLNNELDKITFQDVVDLCEAETLESTVLDYKQSVPRDLAKHFATFSNTLGGLIIIGVEEDPKTGKPLKYEGVAFDGKIVDQIHQFASNVTPFPRYAVHVTDEIKGKVFVLIKILEGDQPPYMSNRDLTVWLRTGNISTPLRNPDSRELEQMHRKKSSAKKDRDNAVNHANQIYDAAFERGEKDRADQATQNESVTKDRLGLYAAPLRITIMPISPSGKIINYRLIKSELEAYRVQTRWYGDFPDLNYETVPHGISFFTWGYDGTYEFGLVQDNGLIDSWYDVLRFDKGKNEKILYLSNILGFLLRQLEVAKKFYSVAGFNGLLDCKVEVSNLKNAWIYQLQPEGWHVMFNRTQISKLDNYIWEIEDLDTFKLNDPSAMLHMLYEFVERLYWDFGISPPQKELIEAQLTQLGWKLPEKETKSE